MGALRLQKILYVISYTLNVLIFNLLYRYSSDRDDRYRRNDDDRGGDRGKPDDRDHDNHQGRLVYF